MDIYIGSLRITHASKKIIFPQGQAFHCFFPFFPIFLNMGLNENKPSVLLLCHNFYNRWCFWKVPHSSKKLLILQHSTCLQTLTWFFPADRFKKLNKNLFQQKKKKKTYISQAFAPRVCLLRLNMQNIPEIFQVSLKHQNKINRITNSPRIDSCKWKGPKQLQPFIVISI